MFLGELNTNFNKNRTNISSARSTSKKGYSHNYPFIKEHNFDANS